jgi:hypothetical protein
MKKPRNDTKQTGTSINQNAASLQSSANENESSEIISIPPLIAEHLPCKILGKPVSHFGINVIA